MPARRKTPLQRANTNTSNSISRGGAGLAKRNSRNALKQVDVKPREIRIGLEVTDEMPRLKRISGKGRLSWTTLASRTEVVRIKTRTSFLQFTKSLAAAVDPNTTTGPRDYSSARPTFKIPRDPIFRAGREIDSPAALYLFIQALEKAKWKGATCVWVRLTRAKTELPPSSTPRQPPRKKAKISQDRALSPASDPYIVQGTDLKPYVRRIFANWGPCKETSCGEFASQGGRCYVSPFTGEHHPITLEKIRLWASAFSMDPTWSDAISPPDGLFEWREEVESQQRPTSVTAESQQGPTWVTAESQQGPTRVEEWIHCSTHAAMPFVSQPSTPPPDMSPFHLSSCVSSASQPRQEKLSPRKLYKGPEMSTLHFVLRVSWGNASDLALLEKLVIADMALLASIFYHNMLRVDSSTLMRLEDWLIRWSALPETEAQTVAAIRDDIHLTHTLRDEMSLYRQVEEAKLRQTHQIPILLRREDLVPP